MRIAICAGMQQNEEMKMTEQDLNNYTLVVMKDGVPAKNQREMMREFLGASMRGPITEMQERIADLEQTIKNKDYASKMLQDRIAELEKDAKWSDEWNAGRYAALRIWALTLPEPQQTEYFNIVANGKPRP
jgi:predicted RNase H-like nuclease (RuvC/YqgF family)